MPPKKREEGVLVETGTFRVDRRRALEKLKNYQVPGRLGGLLIFVRCAAAAGATEIRIRQQACWLEIRFNGKPFSRRRLQDPYGCLFEESGKSGPRARFLALGLLGVLRAEPRSVEVVSGRGEGRVRLSVASLSDDSLTPEGDDGETDTVIQMSWSDWGREASESFHLGKERYAERCRMSRAMICVGDSLLHDPEEDFPGGVSFRGGGVRARLAIPERLNFSDASLSVSCFGVHAAQVEFPLKTLKVRGWVNDDRLRLNASMTNVVRNESFERMRAAVARGVDRLIRHTALEQPARMRELGRKLYGNERFAALWDRKIIRGGRAERPGSFPDPVWEILRGWLRLDGQRDVAVDEFLEDAHITLWLREAANALIPSGVGGERKYKALWRAPLFVDVNGEPLSLQDIGGINRRATIFYSSSPRPPGAARVLWCVSAMDTRWLNKRFMGRLKKAPNAPGHCPTGRR